MATTVPEAAPARASVMAPKGSAALPSPPVAPSRTYLTGRPAGRVGHSPLGHASPTARQAPSEGRSMLASAQVSSVSAAHGSQTLSPPDRARALQPVAQVPKSTRAGGAGAAGLATVPIGAAGSAMGRSMLPSLPPPSASAPPSVVVPSSPQATKAPQASEATRKTNARGMPERRTLRIILLVRSSHGGIGHGSPAPRAVQLL